MEKPDPNVPLTIYIREINDIDPLTKEEETKLFRELGGPSNWSQAQENVARRLFESQLALVVSIARKHSVASGVPMLDLIQEGNIGLMNAVRSFAENPIGDFSARAATCIEDAITNAPGKSR